jgi:MerR family copper efflux transcriptional regulator
MIHWIYPFHGGLLNFSLLKGIYDMEENYERVRIIEKLLTYKIYLENSQEDLIDELVEYYTNKESPIEDIDGSDSGLKDVKDVSYENPYVAYMTTQIKLVEMLPPVIEEHIGMLNVGDDIDLVLESFELEVYSLKKDIYCDLREWEVLLNHVSDERIQEIKCNPRGHGDLILKELLWIKKFEDKL